GESHPRLKAVLAALEHHRAFAFCDELHDDERNRLTIDYVVGLHPLAPARHHVAPRACRGIDVEEVTPLLGNLVRKIPRLGCRTASRGGLGSAHEERFIADAPPRARRAARYRASASRLFK